VTSHSAKGPTREGVQKIGPPIVIYDLVGPTLALVACADELPCRMNARGLQATAAAP
jgi:hypothetical protein